MKSFARILIVLTVLCFPLGVLAQQPQASTGKGAPQVVSAPSHQAGYVIRPSSDTAPPGYAHTTYVLGSLDGKTPARFSTPQAIVTPGPAGAEPDITLFEEPETPQSMGCIYVSSPVSTGCIPNYSSGSGGPSSLGYGAIALVDAYDNPTAAADLAEFDSYWGLTAANFTKIWANGNGDCPNGPPANAGWAFEEDLDIEWAHVFAPKAAIVLVEACSNSYTDLFYAEEVAFSYIATNFKTTGGGQVSNSWQGGEPGGSGQYGDDLLFTDHLYTSGQGWIPAIQAFASSGDGGYEGNTTGYPSGNPWVVSAGGTSVMRNAANDYYYAQYCWAGSGGGYSMVEHSSTTFTGGNIGAWADFQYPIYGGVTNGSVAYRTTPDFSFNADPASGVIIYCGYACGDYPGWYYVGGTSVSSPSLASIVNRAGNKLGTVHLNAITGNNAFFTTAENNLTYATLPAASAYGSSFTDVTIGSNWGPFGSSSAIKGYDTCTGLGAAHTTTNK